MITFDSAVKLILQDEGALSNNLSTDPHGGLTNFGISQIQNPDVDVLHLTRERAIDLYRNRYWVPVWGDSLPSPLNLLVFDCAVNQGVKAAIDILQTAVGVARDGVIGDVTLAAVKRRDATELTARFTSIRLQRYTELSGFGANGQGWFYRVAINLLAVGRGV